MNMDENETERTLVPQEEDASPPEELACYNGVPVEIADECENIYTISRTIRLQALKRVRDLLAPYGRFKQWCHDHDENYGSVTYALSRAYGQVGERAVKGNLIGGLLEAPPATDAQAVNQALVQQVRVLEARLGHYESLTAGELRAEAQRREEEEGRPNADIIRIVMAIYHDDAALGQAVSAGELTIAQALARLLLRDGVALKPLRDAEEQDLYRAVLWVSTWAQLRKDHDQDQPVPDATIARLVAML